MFLLHFEAQVLATFLLLVEMIPTLHHWLWKWDRTLCHEESVLEELEVKLVGWLLLLLNFDKLCLVGLLPNDALVERESS